MFEQNGYLLTDIKSAFLKRSVQKYKLKEETRHYMHAVLEWCVLKT